MSASSPATSGGRHSPQNSEKACCMGALYFSAARNQLGLKPVCAGVRQKIDSEHSAAQLQSETLPPGHFRYLCVGRSLYDDTRLHQRQATGKGSEDVELPYCEGLQIVSAAVVQRPPVLLEEGGADSVGGASAGGPQTGPSGTLGNRDGRRWVTDALPTFPSKALDNFPEKLSRSAQRMVAQMSKNAAFLADTAKRTVERMQETVWGGRRDA